MVIRPRSVLKTVPGTLRSTVRGRVKCSAHARDWWAVVFTCTASFLSFQLCLLCKLLSVGREECANLHTELWVCLFLPVALSAFYFMYF